MSQVDAVTALARLRDGNQRFVEGRSQLDPRITHARREELVEGQRPFAVVLGCSDSRVPVEIVFDQGLGELFVIRVAGNIVAASQVGSVEFAAEAFGARLVVVLGHSGCGAIAATIDACRRVGEPATINLAAIVDRIRPAVETVVAEQPAHEPERLAPLAVRANVRASAQVLRNGSPLLRQLIAQRGLVVVGAEYALDTGEVDFFDGVPG